MKTAKYTTSAVKPQVTALTASINKLSAGMKLQIHIAITPAPTVITIYHRFLRKYLDTEVCNSFFIITMGSKIIVVHRLATMA